MDFDDRQRDRCDYLLYRRPNWAGQATTTGRKVDDDWSKWTSVGGEWRTRPPAPPAPPPPPPEYFDEMAAFYLEALRRLPLADLPYLASCVWAGGLTVGLADPVNNIILSAIVLYIHSPLSGLKVNLTTISKESFLDAARRSHAGAVVFMQYHFRYLTRARAARYLRLAGQDLALAIQLVQIRRGCKGVLHTEQDPRSARIRSALKLAACEAKYPVPDHLVRFMVWSVPLPLLNPILDDLQQGNPLSLHRVTEIIYLLRHLPATISGTDPLRADFGHFSDLTNVDPSSQRRILSIAATEAAMAADPDDESYDKMAEQDIAHLMYIKALSLLPTDALRGKLLENKPQMARYYPSQQQFVRTQLENLLLEYSRNSHLGSAYKYELGVICGVASAQYGCINTCYHVNFLASVCEDRSKLFFTAASVREAERSERSELFFAELWFPPDLRIEDSTRRPRCCRIDYHSLSELGRCYICEADDNSRLVHPPSQDYFLSETIAFEDLCMIAKKGASAFYNGPSYHHRGEDKGCC